VLVRRRLSTGDKSAAPHICCSPEVMCRFINKYLIIRELGRGSFGGVYLVRDEEMDKYYAMKMISKSLPSLPLIPFSIL
jgi:serine/threonine protein kinase